MSLFRTILVCATVGLGTGFPVQKVRAQSSGVETVGATKTGTAAEEAAKAAKAAKRAANEEKRKTHLVCAIEFRFGRDRGDVIFELFPEDAPETVENFRQQVEKGFYNKLAVHRAVKDYLVQTGDPASRDDKARETWGLTQETTMPAEIKRNHSVGAVAMARRGDKVNPDRRSDGSQFYFALGNLGSLDGQYTVFGQVISGLSVLKRISRLATDSNDCPMVRVEIRKIKIAEQTGPLVSMTATPSGKRKVAERPEALKGPIERFFDRIW